MLKQSDIVEQRRFYDTVGHGGWAIDLHPADGVFSEKPSCNQWHSKGIYEIPYRSMVSKNIENLFLAGRIISASHVAFGSTRVMATCAHNAQAVGMAAALTIKHSWDPDALIEENRMKLLQLELLKSGQHIPHVAMKDAADLIHKNKSIKASSELYLSEIPFNGAWIPLMYGAAQLLPLDIGSVPKLTFEAKAQKPSTLTVTLRRSEKAHNFTPDIVLATKTLDLVQGAQMIDLDFNIDLKEKTYIFVCFHEHKEIAIKGSQTRITGLVSVFNKQNKAVSNFGRQDPDPKLGFESFEFWVPIRRPGGQNIAMKLDPPLDCCGVGNLLNGFQRPYLGPNAWVASVEDRTPELTIEWEKSQSIQSVVLSFDTDWDYPMESSLLGHAENQMPFVVWEYQILDHEGKVIHEEKGNYQTRNVVHFKTPVTTDRLVVRLNRPSAQVPVSLFSISCYPQP